MLIKNTKCETSCIKMEKEKCNKPFCTYIDKTRKYCALNRKLFRFNKELGLQRNKMLMGLVINKLLLAFKNKQGFLEELVMESEPSLYSILVNIKDWMSRHSKETPEELQRNSEKYFKSISGGAQQWWRALEPQPFLESDETKRWRFANRRSCCCHQSRLRFVRYF